MIDLFIKSEKYSTRKHILLWIGIWIALFFTSWYCRPLLPFHETAIASTSWNLQTGLFYSSEAIDLHANNFALLLNYLELFIWQFNIPKEFALRLITSLFSLGVLLLSAWTTKQLWPNDKKTRTLVPLVLIGSLIWTFFATAHINAIPLSFFSLLSINILILIWKSANKKLWLLFYLSFTLGLFSNSLIFIFYVLPLGFIIPFCSKDMVNTHRYWHLSFLISTIFAIATFISWGFYTAYQHTNIPFHYLIGIQPLFSSLSNTPPLAAYLFSLPFILFPWALWLPIYKNIHANKSEPHIRFCLYWFLIELFIITLLGASSITPLLPIYPVFSIIIAKSHKKQSLHYLDALPIFITMFFMGLAFIIIPLLARTYQLPDWIGEISPLWGAGLISLGIIFTLNVKKTRLQTLTLMSLALTIAINFGIVRQSQEYYDTSNIAQRISWYEKNHYPLAHQGRYLGQFHFTGRLEKNFFNINDHDDLIRFKQLNPQGRVILYLPVITPELKENLEYWQPFRSQYIAIAAVDKIHNLSSFSE